MPKSSGGVLLAGLKISRSSAVPKYRQLDASLRKLILTGTLVPGQKLPSTRELANELEVSRITVKSVYEQLVAEGYAEAKTGSGTYIAEGLEFESSPKKQDADQLTELQSLKLPDHAFEIMHSEANIRHGKTLPFRPGVPALDMFPLKLWHKYLLEALNSDARHNMSYGEACGSPSLRQSIARHLGDARGMQVDAEQVIVTSGAQAAFVLISFVLLKQGNTVWYENPGHIAGRDVMQLMGADVRPVPIDNEGLDLGYAIENHEMPSLIFATPSHQQPLGTTMSLSRRLALLNYANQNNAWVIEDDYDSEFRYRGRPLPALSALDNAGQVLYVGTFSKSLCAAIRVGYVVVPKTLTEVFASANTLLGNGSSAVTEEALSRFMDDGRFVEHVRKMRRVYRERRDILYACLIEFCSDFLEPQVTDAGMHIVAWLKNGLDDKAVHQLLLDVGIESLPLSAYSVSSLKRPAIVLGFSCAAERQIEGWVKRMSKALQQQYGDRVST